MATKIRIAGRDVEIRPTLADRFVNWADPVKGSERLYHRAAQAVAAGGYTGARSDRRQTSNWKPRGSSADADLLPDLAALRERSRDLVRNAPIAAGALNTMATNVIGTGLMLKSRVRRDILGWTEEQAAAWQRGVEQRFCAWAESPLCDVTLTQNFYGLQDLVLRSTLENGDTLSLLPYVRRAGYAHQLAVQLIEADRLCNKDTLPDTPTLAGGVRMDKAGAPVAYQVLNCHPGDRLATKREWTEYPAFGGKTGRRNVLHHYVRRRIGQTRGAPWLSGVIEIFKQISTYTDAEIFAAVATSMFAIETRTEDRGGLSPLESAVSGTTPSTGTIDAAKGSSWDGSLTPGLAIDLGLNEEVKGFNPNRPNANFDPFVQAMLRQCGVYLELPFEVLIKHFTASYSAARSALLEAWKTYRVRRAWAAASFCQPVFEAWLEEDIALGYTDAPGFFDDPLLRYAYCGSVWHGDGPGSIDPYKEAMAAEKRLAINLRTLEQEIAEDSGGDVVQVLEQRGRERKLERDLGAAAPDKSTNTPDPRPNPDRPDTEVD